ncbi:MAG: class I adenylate-forming enzyme family protein, partial [Nocardioidaceae bacterium]
MTTDPSSWRPSDRIALLVRGSVPYAQLCVSLLSRGIVPVPMDPNLTAAERDRLLPYVDPCAVLTDQASIEETLAALPIPEPALPLGRPMHLTSGTTGSPKGVFSGLLDESAARALVTEERDLWGFDDADVNLVLSPMHHSAPLRFAMGTLLAGGTVVVPGPFDPATVTDAILRHRPTTMFCVPTHLQRLFAHWEGTGVPDLTCFRLVAHAGAACPVEVKQRLVALFPEGSTWEFYGSTEGQFTACRSEEAADRPGTVGRARPGRALSVDEDGMLWCTVPEHARFTYWRAPEKTAAAWRTTVDGRSAFTVGDLGRIDTDGYVYLDGRREDLIITGGVNVYPVEVESVLGECPGVTEIAVYARPDPTWGQRVCAAVVGEVTAEALDAYARERLSPAKRPKEYVLRDALPHTS